MSTSIRMASTSAACGDRPTSYSRPGNRTRALCTVRESPNAQVDAVVLRGQLAADRLQPAVQSVTTVFAFQGEVEVFGVARQAEQKTQARSPVKRQ